MTKAGRILDDALRSPDARTVPPAGRGARSADEVVPAPLRRYGKIVRRHGSVPRGDEMTAHTNRSAPAPADVEDRTGDSPRRVRSLSAGRPAAGSAVVVSRLGTGPAEA